MIEYGTTWLASYSGKGGTKHLERPVSTRCRRRESHRRKRFRIFVPPPYAADPSSKPPTRSSAHVCITEGIPALDMVRVASVVDSRKRALSARTAGIISPGKCKIGIMPAVSQAGKCRRRQPQRHFDL